MGAVDTLTLARLLNDEESSPWRSSTPEDMAKTAAALLYEGLKGV